MEQNKLINTSTSLEERKLYLVSFFYVVAARTVRFPIRTSLAPVYKATPVMQLATALFHQSGRTFFSYRSCYPSYVRYSATGMTSTRNDSSTSSGPSQKISVHLS